jgi:splicing factor 3A subunit 1
MVISGIIRPPPEIRVVADRTAQYVAKNGRAFEVRILKSERGKTPKFAFLHDTSPFHAYYEDRIVYFQQHDDDDDGSDDDNEKEDKTKKKREKDPSEERKATVGTTAPISSTLKTRKKEKKQKASAIDPIAKALLEQRTRILKAKALQGQKDKDTNKESNKDFQEPDDDDDDDAAMVLLHPPSVLELAAIVAPYNLTATQIETIQLVAQFTAMDGKGGPFLHQLTLREWNNPEFQFCQPRHSHFAYFSALVDAYRMILRDWITSNNAATTTTTTPETILQEAAYRAEYERYQHLEQSQKQQEEGEIVAIDWHNFVVVETIDFPADEMVVNLLPPPAVAELEMVSSPTTAAAAAAAASLVPPTNHHDGNAMDESSDEDDDDDNEDETIRVVPSYQPKVVGASDLSSARAIDPITGKSISLADIPEHLRIQLLHPKWAEERKKFQEKQKDSNLVSGDAMVANISRLVRQREEESRAAAAVAATATTSTTAIASTVKPVPTTTSVSLTVPKRSVEAVGGLSTVGTSIVVSSSSLPMEPMTKKPRWESNVFETGDVTDLTFKKNADAALEEDPVTEVEDKKLLSEQDFLASLDSANVTLQIKIPNDSTQMAWNFYGQLVSIETNVMSKVKDVKTQLSQAHLNDMPANKIVLKDPRGGFLSNNATLASLNIGPIATLEMSVKQRGGRK